MSLGGGLSGGSHSEHSASTSRTPWTTIANQLAGTLKSNLSGIASGSNVDNWIKSITASTKQSTKEGISNIKEAFGASGMGASSDVAKSIGDFQTKQQLGLDTEISQIQQTGIQDQLAALSEIISLASGSGVQTGAQHGSNFGWNFAAGFPGR